MELNFKCPDCGSDELEEIRVGDTVSSRVTAVYTNSSPGLGEQRVNEDGTIDRYQCVGCGSFIQDTAGKPITDPVELHAWFADNGMLAEEIEYPFAVDDGRNGYVQVTKDVRVQYRWGLANADGAYYVLRRENHAFRHLTAVDRYLRATQDVVKLEKVDEKRWAAGE